MGQAAPINAIRRPVKSGLYLKSVVNGRVMIAGEPFIVPLTHRKRTQYIYVIGERAFIYDWENHKIVAEMEKEKYGPEDIAG